MDRNSVIGFLLLGILVVGYVFYNQRSQEQYLKQKAHQDSIAKLENPKQLAADTTAAATSSATAAQPKDTTKLNTVYGVFTGDTKGTLQTQTIENKLMTLTFTNKGGVPQKIILKKYKTYGGQPLEMKGREYDQLHLVFPNTNTLPVNTGDLYFVNGGVTNEADGSQVISYRLNTNNADQYLEYTYTIHPNKYMVDWDIKLMGFNHIIPAQDNTIQLQWQSQADHQEKDIEIERRSAQVFFNEVKNGVDYFSLYKTKEKQLDEPLQWVSCKQEFFNAALIAQKDFSSAEVNAQLPDDSSDVVARTQVILKIPYTHTQSYDFPVRFYYGPNDYTRLKSYGIGLENVVPLGYGIEAFVKYINKWIILPVFLLLGKLIGNWGIVIILLTIVLRLLISPLTYKSYVSQAKMKVLKPELDELKKKYKDDQQKFGTEQMKLFRTAGVSPLGGCVPMLLQIPIFFALYSLFMSNLELRQQHFLWIKDLSTYDSIYHLPFKIPIYGDHVSLLTLLMTITSIIMAFYNRNMTMNAAGQDNPAFKYMPFILPIFFLGFFNSLAAGLTLYYLVSNIITILIQVVIQNYIIDEKKIHQQIQENKKKPQKASRWQQRLDEIQKTQATAQKRK
jgi:YidC/Oxa1 family membrane protein insertase